MSFKNAIGFFVKRGGITLDPDFVITVDTTKAGSASNTFVLPTSGSGYDCTILWGDGSSSDHSGIPGNITKVYDAAGTYQIRIQGTFPRIYFNNKGDKLKVTNVSFGLHEFGTMNAAFFGCSNIISLGNYPIQGNQLVAGGFANCFRNLSLLESLPIDIFRYSPNVTTFGFQEVFNGCAKLKNVQEDLFRYNINVSQQPFYRAFFGCSSLLNAPCFRYNVNAFGVAFQETFMGCVKLQLNRNIFYADGEQGTRFLNKSISFAGCFSRTSFSGAQGEAPDLWNCDFGTGTPTKTSCFAGAGNSLTSISNYNDIPADWK